MALPDFRSLYKDLMRHEGEDVSSGVLLPWLPKARQALDGMQRYRYLASSNPGPDVEAEELWQWYALNRVNDHLLYGFQIGQEFPQDAPLREWSGSVVSSAAYLNFFETLGFHSFSDRTFSPFYHEIVEVVTDETMPSAVVEHEFWPGLLFSEMLFSRAGVRVRAPAHLMAKDVAERSVMYFTFKRLRRQASDQSHG